MNCEEKKGFLILKRCENSASLECEICGEKICEKHSREKEFREGEKIVKKILCLSCAKNILEEIYPGERDSFFDISSSRSEETFGGFGGGSSGGAGAGRSFSEESKTSEISPSTKDSLTEYTPILLDERFSKEDYAVFEKGGERPPSDLEAS
jgi:hypothetical protein